MTNQERITAALAAIGFEVLRNNNGPLLIDHQTGLMLTIWDDGIVTFQCHDPNWPAIPAVMTQVAEIVQGLDEMPADTALGEALPGLGDAMSMLNGLGIRS